MKNLNIRISEDIQEKILYKHGLEFDHIYAAIKDGRPKFIRKGGNIYIAITHHFQYITVVFSYHKNFARVITAYESSAGQIKKYKRK